jgi:hypothetical protein
VLVSVPVQTSVPPGGTGYAGQFHVSTKAGQSEQNTVTVWLQMLPAG